MRTELQIKSKINELKLQKNRLNERISNLQPEQEHQRTDLLQQTERVEDMVLMLEWVLDAPVGSYHM